MTSDGKTPSSQSGFFSDSGELGGSHPQFTEICTALYERELLHIAHYGPANISILRRRLTGLPHHIRSVARFLISNNAPLDIDAHNASWFIKQPAKCPGMTQTAENKKTWYARHADYGLVIPVAVSTLEGIHLELDSIDSVDSNTQRLHSNKLGWFTFDGEVASQSCYIKSDISPYINSSTSPNRNSNKSRGSNKSQGKDPHETNNLEAIDETATATGHNDANAITKIQLLKPTTAIMASACSGHTWRHKSKGAPRALSLREMRLSTQINWKNFTLKAST